MGAVSFFLTVPDVLPCGVFHSTGSPCFNVFDAFAIRITIGYHSNTSTSNLLFEKGGFFTRHLQIMLSQTWCYHNKWLNKTNVMTDAEVLYQKTHFNTIFYKRVTWTHEPFKPLWICCLIVASPRIN